MIKQRLLSVGFCFGSLVFCSSAMALNIQPCEDNGRVMVAVSATEVTRLVVQGDRIKQLIGVKGAYRLAQDDSSGELYIQPSLAYAHRAFSVFIQTEHGFHATVVLSPSVIPADTVRLVPKGAAETTRAWEIHHGR